MKNNKIEMSDDIQTPLLGGATTGNDLKHSYFNWSFETIFRYMKTLILGAEDRADRDADAPKTLDEFLNSLPRNVRKRVQVLQEIQAQHDEVEAKYFEERAALEAEYEKLYQPFYNMISDIVNGVVEVEGVSSEAIVDKKEEKGVPYFWLTAMKTNVVVADEIQERDEGALKYLKDIKWCRVENLKGFKLEFYFNPNPYFKNTILTKIYEMMDEAESILYQAIGTEIEWLPGKNLTQKVPREGSEKCESFFNFFNPPQVPDSDDDLDEETAEDLQGQMDQHYVIGATIREKIIPNAVSWFTGVADTFECEETD